ncbi:MAG TPA: O-antigen ligase family protein [Pirellulales bacterium]|nr:O-antigen ligase family protein [Pirellulales bacterium]
MTPIIAIAALVAVAWLAAVLWRSGPLAAALLVLLAGSCFGYFFYHLDASPIPLTADRVLFVALILQCALWRRLGWLTPRPAGKPEFVLAAFIATLVVSTLANDWTYQHNQPLSKLLFYYLMPTGMYWAARQLPLNERSSRWLSGSLALFGVYLAATAVAEWLRLPELIFPRYIASADYFEFFGRARGPLMNPIGNGYFLAVGLASTLLWWPRLGRPGQLALLLVAALFGCGLFATLTRCVWMGAVLMLLVIAGLTLPRSWRLPCIGGTLLVLVLGGATQWQRLLEFKRDVGQSERETAQSVELRPILAMVAWRMFVEQPLTGCGFGHYRDKFADVLDRDSDLPLDQARPYVQHNVWLGLLTETGLPGTGLFIVLLGYWLRDAWRLWHSPAPLWARQYGLLFLATFGSYLSNGMFQDLTIIPMVNMLLFFLAGLTQVRTSESI